MEENTNNKKVILTISNEGSASKTTIAKLIKEAYIYHKVDHLTLLCDKDHTELLETYGSKDVQSFDIRTNKEAFINCSLETSSDVIADFPASSIDELYRVFGDMNAFIESFKAFGAMLYFVVPVISDKSILSIERFAELLEGIDDGYQFVFVLNEGLMTNKNAITQAFHANKFVKSSIADWKAQVVTINTIFTSGFSQIVKTQKLRQFLTQKSNPMDKILMMNLLNSTDTQFAKVFGLIKD